MLSRWMWSSYTRLRLESRSRKKIFMTDITYMGCKFVHDATWGTMLTGLSRNDVVVAAICPEWHKLLDT